MLVCVVLCSLVVTCWERADLLAVVCVVFCHFPKMCLGPHQNQGWGWRRETGLSPPVKYFTDRSKAVLLFWIFDVFVLSCVCYVFCASVYMCFVVTCWERADLLALVCGVFCEFVTFPLVSWVRCGTWLYRFLIFAPLLTFIYHKNRKAFSKFYHRQSELIVKYNIGLKILMHQGKSEPVFYGDLVFKF